MTTVRRLTLIVVAAALVACIDHSSPGAEDEPAPPSTASESGDQKLTAADRVGIAAAIINAISTGALALLTWRYVALTQRILKATAAAREPYVDIELNSPDNKFRLAFVNAGGSAARNITFSVLRDSDAIEHGAGRKGIASIEPIEGGISYLPAGQRLLFDAGFYRSPPPPGAEFLTISVSFSNDGGATFSRTVHYDLRQLDRLLFETFHNNFVGVSNAIREATRDVVDSQKPSPMANYGKRGCPLCGMPISINAKKCPHCHEWVPSDPPETLADA